MIIHLVSIMQTVWKEKTLILTFVDLFTLNRPFHYWLEKDDYKLKIFTKTFDWKYFKQVATTETSRWTTSRTLGLRLDLPIWSFKILKNFSRNLWLWPVLISISSCNKNLLAKNKLDKIYISSANASHLNSYKLVMYILHP